MCRMSKTFGMCCPCDVSNEESKKGGGELIGHTSMHVRNGLICAALRTVLRFCTSQQPTACFQQRRRHLRWKTENSSVLDSLATQACFGMLVRNCLVCAALRTVLRSCTSQQPTVCFQQTSHSFDEKDTEECFHLSWKTEILQLQTQKHWSDFVRDWCTEQMGGWLRRATGDCCWSGTCHNQAE